METRTLTCFTTLIVLAVLAVPFRLAAQITNSDITTFDAPGADQTRGSNDGTFPSSINAAGTITGRYVGMDRVIHGFVLSPAGEFTTFDAPGASNIAGLLEGTFPKSINKAGAITGNYADNENVFHGFVRSPKGRFITFDAPGAGAARGSGWGTFPESINDAGTITGHYTDAYNVSHGFVRSPGGEFITFEAPGAGATPGSGSGTFPEGIDGAGAITGSDVDAKVVNHGFLWAP